VSAAEPPLVDGATRLYAIIGDPIAQVGSPRVFTTRFRAAGMNALMLPFHVRPDRFGDTLRGIMTLANLDGIVVTVPYKARVLPFVERVLATAKQVGAVNAIRRDPDGAWTGDMFDGRGLVRGLAAHQYAVAGKRAMLIGAGGAGSAIAFALAEAGAAAVTLFDLDAQKSNNLAARVRDAYPSCRLGIGAPTGDDHDLLINATPTGMSADDGLPAPLPPLARTLFVADVITKPEVTPLLRYAQACGCPTMGGGHMLEGQADEIMRFFGMKVQNAASPIPS